MSDGPSSTGLLSGVFSFVSREFESFLITATGGAVTEPEDSLSRDNSPESSPPASSRAHHETARNPGGPVRTPRRAPGSSKDRQRAAAERQRRRRSPSASVSPEHPQRSRPPDRRVIVVEEEDSCSEHSQSRSPSPPPPPGALRRRHSITMPGSLFPRSASSEPESHPVEEPRQVRFAPDVVSPPARSRSQTARPADGLPPFRPPAIVSVVERFHVGVGDPDPSMLPSPKGMSRATAPEEQSPRISAREKGKGRAYDLEDADTSGEVRVRGKERELFAALEEQKLNEKRRWERDKEKEKEDGPEDSEREKDKERIRMLENEILRLKQELSSRPLGTFLPQPPPPPPPPPPPMPPGGRLPTATPFAAARASLKSTGTLPAEAPINPILPTRRHGQPTLGVPPDKVAAFLAEMKTVRLRKTSSFDNVGESSNRRGTSTGSTDHNSVNIGGRGMSAGNAAILKKLGESLSRPHASTSSNAGGNRSWEAPQTPPWKRELNAAKAGQKRKWETLRQEDSGPGDDQPPASKRRSSSSSSSLQYRSSAAPSQSQPPSRHEIPRESPITPSLSSDKGRDDDDDSDERFPSTPPAMPPPDTYIPVRKVFAPPPRKEREIIDVDMEGHGGGISITPPRSTRAPVGSRRPVSRADVFAMRPPSSPMPIEPSPRKPRPPARTPRAPPPPTPPPQAEEEQEDELSLSFDAPDAPPDLSPGHRRPPSKGKAKAVNGKAKTREHAPPPRSQSPLLPPLRIPTRREKERTSAAPSIASTSSRGTAGRTKNRRRQTLEDELRSAAIERSRSRSYSRSSYHDREGEEEEEDGLDSESGTLVGVGTRSKSRGFLARGGAGGDPVFMGAGYVEGVEDDPDVDQAGDGDDDDYEPPPTGGRKARR
ncbi:hypothetical protein C8R47DRAFT_1161009 [Mycena vitilis]|nr:hypothetical protein C8R47DRAFT_1161009 [Mycena vitilis]